MDNKFSFADGYLNAHYTRDEVPNPNDFFMHTHERYELFYFFEGKGSFKVEGTSYTLENGDILIMRPKESHYIVISPDVPYARLAIHFEEKLFKHIDLDGKLTAPFLNHELGHFNRYRSSDFANDNYKHYINNMLKPTDNKRLQLISNLLPLLYEISIASENKTDDNPRDTLDNKIIRYINANLFYDINLDSLCKEFFISKPQLCRIFKSATGTTVWDYITVKRLSVARSLIEEGQSPTLAANNCGFNDYSAFYRAYKKKYGVAPSENKQ